MSQQQLSLSPDLKQLRDEGFEVEIRSQHLLIHNVPYVNSQKKICRGTLVSTLNFSENVTVRPETHVIYFAGEYPCNKDGTPIEQIRHASQTQTVGGVTVNHAFSNKPKEGFPNYYEKMTSYANILSAPAASIDSDTTAKNFKPIMVSAEESVFTYFDSSSSRSGILKQGEKFKNQKVGIIGLGGTGSYILELVSKVPVLSIDLIDGDKFMQHNAFRSPGAASSEVLASAPFKTDYHKSTYEKIHRNITSHPVFVTQENIKMLKNFTVVFICIDRGEARKLIMDYLIENKILFIDVGMGVNFTDDKLRGSLRVTTGLFDNKDHIAKRVSFVDAPEDEYNRNIQLADLNCLNATLAVIKWKKLLGFYLDLENELNTTYDTDGNYITNDEANNA
ncbi:MAG: ThiF family adenylyltransferase [Pseudobdellovibrio sp.]